MIILFINDDNPQNIYKACNTFESPDKFKSIVEVTFEKRHRPLNLRKLKMQRQLQLLILLGS